VSPGAADRPAASHLRGLGVGLDRGFSFVMVGRLVGMIERTVWPDSDCLARPLGGATIDSRLDQRVYRAMQG
jgi:hypothetical protein